MAFEQVGQSLGQFSRRSPIRAAATALRVEQEAQKHLPAWAKMISFREGRLILGTPSPTHSQELFLQSAVLKKKINEGMATAFGGAPPTAGGRKVVTGIRFRVVGS